MAFGKRRWHILVISCLLLCATATENQVCTTCVEGQVSVLGPGPLC